MATFSLSRTGQPQLTFCGELIAEASSHRIAGQDRNRWHDLAVYRTDGGTYVLLIRYSTQWQGEHEHEEAITADTPREVADAFGRHDSTKYVCGYPPGEQYAERQERLLRTIRQDYQQLVSEVLSSQEFTETID